MTTSPTTVVPRPAATVAILRDGADGVDVWLMRRHSAMAFAAGMQAFPGGALEPADQLDLPWSAPSRDALATVLGLDELAAGALVSAAVRETFEECGVLLAAPQPVVAAHSFGVAPVEAAVRPAEAAGPPDLEPARLALVEDANGWAALLRGHGFVIDTGALVPWSRWITPDWSPRRFDAYFFLARLPEGQSPRWIDGEADDARWWGVRSAVAAHERGALPMLPPTIETLRSIAQHDTVAGALAAGPSRIEAHDG